MGHSRAHELKEFDASTPSQNYVVQNGPGSGACGRCGGFMVRDVFLDGLDETGLVEFQGSRCVQCGDLTDPVILQNRAKQNGAVDARRLQMNDIPGRSQAAHNPQKPA